MTDNTEMLSDSEKEFTCSNCGRVIIRGHFVPSSEGGGDWVCEESVMELKNGLKIIAQPSGEPLRGLTSSCLLWADEEIVDNPPECAKLIGENFDNLLLK